MREWLIDAFKKEVNWADIHNTELPRIEMNMWTTNLCSMKVLRQFNVDIMKKIFKCPINCNS